MTHEPIFENAARGNFAGLKGLIEEQAAHHESTYRGDDEAFIAELEGARPVAHGLLMREFNASAFSGGIVYNKLCGFKGEHLYIEDIIVSQKQRGGGAGSKLVEELKRLGRAGGADAITWLVAQNNEGALKFYQNKLKASEMPVTIIDASALLDARPAAPDRYSVVPVNGDMLALLRENIEAYPNIQPKHLDNAQKAMENYAHAEVLAAIDDEGHLGALAVLNGNYSSFRTVYGYKLELLEADKNAPDNAAAFGDILATVYEIAQAKNHTGHLTISIDRTSPAQSALGPAHGWMQLQMTDNPASAMDMYTVPCAEVIEALKKHVGNDNLAAPNQDKPAANL